MNFPKKSRELNKIFEDARIPEVSEFDGEYFVDMLTGLPSLKIFSHRKVFYSDKGKVLGHNVLFLNKIWGRFFLEEGIKEGLKPLNSVIINYGVNDNSFITQCIRDQIRAVEGKKLYLGRFNYLFGRKFHFLGYFSLLKK